ncbi:MAG: phosphotransferase family protein [Pseudomonadota bacterium]
MRGTSAAGRASVAQDPPGAPSPEALLACLGAPEGSEVEALRRLSGGANMETWAFDCCGAGRRRPLILRRRPGETAALVPALSPAMPLATEAELMVLARRAGLPVPSVVAQSVGGPLGEALVLSRVDGEALPQRILRDERLATVRGRLAFECGEALGKLHSVALDECPPGLRDLAWDADLDRLQALCDHFGNPSPAQQLGLNWLRGQRPPSQARVLCHGDFRLGNLLIGQGGLQGVLDWELAHIGYPAEDLAYLCANVWRFGSERPVGGFGDYRQLLDGYRSVRGEAPDLDEIKRWELYAALGWGLVCLTMLELHDSGADPGLERAAVGRRCSEADIDILLLLEELGA